MDVVVVGGGQAGLATGHHLARTGRRFAILDASPRVGDSWRNRYDSLTLFTPRRFSALPGLTPPGDPDGYASRDEFADYLESYATHFSLPLRSRARVAKLEKEGDAFLVRTDDGTSIRAARVVVASGAFARAVVPKVASGFAADVKQLTAEDYRNPGSVAEGAVLVVGDGASGRDIAAELAGSRPVYLAGGRPRRLLPERILGRSTWWWLNLVGLMKVSPTSSIGRAMREADPFPDRDRNDGALVKRGVTLKPRVVGADGRRASFVDGTSAEIASVVWTVGYQEDNAWIAIPGATDASGKLIHREGHSPIEGLHFVGRPWQRNRASALVMGAGADAERIVAAIAPARLASPAS